MENILRTTSVPAPETSLPTTTDEQHTQNSRQNSSHACRSTDDTDSPTSHLPAAARRPTKSLGHVRHGIDDLDRVGGGVFWRDKEHVDPPGQCDKFFNRMGEMQRKGGALEGGGCPGVGRTSNVEAIHKTHDGHHAGGTPQTERTPNYWRHERFNQGTTTTLHKGLARARSTDDASLLFPTHQNRDESRSKTYCGLSRPD